MTTVIVQRQGNTVAVTEEDNSVNVTVNETSVLLTAPGAQGPPGPPGANGRSITILQPVSGDAFTIFRTIITTTIVSICALVTGVTPSVTFVLKIAPNRASPGTAITASETITNSTTGTQVVAINQPIPVGYYVWMEIASVSGTVTELNVGIEF